MGLFNFKKANHADRGNSCCGSLLLVMWGISNAKNVARQMSLAILSCVLHNFLLPLILMGTWMLNFCSYR